MLLKVLSKVFFVLFGVLWEGICKGFFCSSWSVKGEYLVYFFFIVVGVLWVIVLEFRRELEGVCIIVVT